LDAPVDIRYTVILSRMIAGALPWRMVSVSLYILVGGIVAVLWAGPAISRAISGASNLHGE
jgi:hypothetical protein